MLSNLAAQRYKNPAIHVVCITGSVTDGFIGRFTPSRQWRVTAWQPAASQKQRAPQREHATIGNQLIVRALCATSTDRKLVKSHQKFKAIPNPDRAGPRVSSITSPVFLL